MLLEQRDGFFTKTIGKVEQLYSKNDNTPVVLLCHSMGCKAAHYFLNFALKTKGRKWIDKHIHTYMPVAAPHLGAQSTLRATVDGDKAGLDAFLSDEDGLLLARSWGSLNWLHPGQLPPHNSPVSIIARREGVLHVKVAPMDVAEIFRERTKIPRELRLAVKFGDRVLPFPVAATLDRLKIMLLPLLTLLLPLIRVAPPLLRWRIRRKIFRWYGYLDRIENRFEEDAKERDDCLADLAKIEREIVESVDVPKSYMEELHNLRMHLERTRDRFLAHDESPSAAS